MQVHRWTWATRNEGSVVQSLDRVAVFAQAGVAFAVLADGAGGMAGAAEAAETVITIASQWDPCDVLASCGGGAASRLEAMDMDHALARAAHGGQCTAVVVALDGESVAGASVGDSAAWMVGEDLVNLTASQHRKPLVGSGRAVAVPFVADLSGRRVLVASDGLWKYAHAARVREIATIEDSEDAATRLLELVRLPSGKLQDDVSIALLAVART
jgi:serine/threonine protein phosphatase PrpC